MKLAELSIRRPVLAVMVIGGLVTLGFISWGRIGVDLFPRVEFPYVTVQTTLEGASPGTIESEISEPIEEQVNTIAGVQSLRSVSSEGLSQVFVEFKLEANGDVKAQEVRDKVAIAQRNLPSDADPPIVQKVDPDAQPILSVMVSANRPIGELTRLADTVIKQRLERISGVGSVELIGGRDREIRIWLDAQKLRAYQVTAEDVINALHRENADVPGGRLEAGGGITELSLKTMGEVTRVPDFAKVVVAYRANGVPTLLGDVARVEEGLKDERTYAELNGRPGISLDVRRQSGENTLAVAQAVKLELERIRPLLGPDIEVAVARDTSIFIEGSKDDVFKDIYIAIALVTLVVFAFLTSLRATIIVALAIPTSLISTFFLFYLGDFTLNMQSLMALQLAAGLLVDDAIVVLESIHRKLEEGRTPMQAAIEGTGQVGMAVIAGTLAVCAVFVPIGFMEGVVGQFFYQYGLSVTFAVLVSLLVSLTLTPMLCANFLRLEKQHGPIARWLEAYHAMVDRLYARLLRLSLAHRGIVALIAVATIFLGFFVAGTIPSAFSSRADRSEFIGQIDLPLGVGVEAAKEVGHRVSVGLQDLPHVRDVFFTIGGGADEKISRISYYVSLAQKGERDISQRDLEDLARKTMMQLAPEAMTISVTEVPWIQGNGQSYELMYSLEGPDLGILREKSEAILAAMRETGFYADARTSYEAGKPEVQILVDRERTADMSIGIRSLATTMRAMVGGVEATTFQDDGERFDVRVRLEADQRDDLSKLSLIQVRGADGSLIDLTNVATIAVAEGAAQVDRRNRARAITVLANLPPGVSMGPAAKRVVEIANEVGIPAGYRFTPVGSVERMEETGRAIFFAFAMAMLALYMVLASQFNSYGQPLIMMLSAPLSFFGAFVALKVSGLEMSMFAQIGLIALMGIVLKNGILLVDHANVARQERGFSALDAMLEAGVVRLRPVLMTALTMIFGMLPPVLSVSQGAEFRAPMAVLIIGGMMSSTILTLLVVPSIYVMSAETGGWVAKRLGRAPKTGGESALPQAGD
ncbi:MAG: MMPL family transporter [Alphaproteobacteria bacterium]|nr:MMPL family transporter [Alphaproteobacteria bacterium]